MGEVRFEGVRFSINLVGFFIIIIFNTSSAPFMSSEPLRI